MVVKLVIPWHSLTAPLNIAEVKRSTTSQRNMLHAGKEEVEEVMSRAAWLIPVRGQCDLKSEWILPEES